MNRELIRAHREDLLTYPYEDLVTLAKYYGIPFLYWPTPNILASRIAFAILDERRN